MMQGLAERLRLIVVTDPECGGRPLIDVVRAALQGGAPAIQLRIKDRDARPMADQARALLAVTRQAGALLFINDRVDVALAVGADGAHLGQSDLAATDVRRISPPGFLVGVSAESAELAMAAQADGADYVGVGPVYATGSKADAGPPVGTERIGAIAAGVRIPVVGIGGITVQNGGAVIRAGAAGVAVISAVMQAADPEAATRALLRR
jgi:thiamine-phosphate pyrophosphorylase